MPLSVRKPQLFALLAIGMLLYGSAYAQFFQAGELDTTFNFGLPHSYFVNTNSRPGAGFENAGNAAQINSIVVQPDGKLLVGGSFREFNGSSRSNIARLNADGTLDQSFNPGLGLNGKVNAVVLQSNGKLIVAGSFSSFNGVNRQSLARINSDGSLDTTFNVGSGASMIETMVLQPDGKILIGGYFNLYNGIARNRIARVNPDGSLDSTFNPGSSANDVISTIALQTDGKIVIGGDFSNYNGVFRNGIARILPNGSLDTTFNPGTGASHAVKCLLIQADGKIIVGGEFVSFNGFTRKGIARLNSNGSLEPNYLNGSGIEGSVFALALQANGKLTVGGRFSSINGLIRSRIGRINVNGTLDTAFSSSFSLNAGTVHAVSILANGQLIIGGSFTRANNVTGNGITRLDSSGVGDFLFNPETGANNHIRDMLILPNGRPLIGGVFTRFNGSLRNSIVGLKENGTIDLSYLLGTGPDNFINTLALQPDGKVLVGGVFGSFNGIPKSRVARLNPNGTLEAAFISGSGLALGNEVRTIALQSDGRIILGGQISGFNGADRRGFLRLLPDGTLDSSLNLGIASGIVYSAAVQPDGRILLAGVLIGSDGITIYNLVRLNGNGSLDTTFTQGITGLGTLVQKIFLLPNNKILISGTFTTYNGVNRNQITVLNANGSVDTAFNPGTGANGAINAIAVQPDGKMILGGNFTSYAGVVCNRIGRINTDGSLDTTFNSNLGADGEVTSLVYQPDGKVIIGGVFTNYNGINRQRIARIYAPSCTTSVTNTTSTANICIGDTKSLVGTPGGSWEIAYGPGQITGTTYTANGGSGTVSLYNRVGSCYSPLVTFNVDFPAAPLLRDTAVCAGSAVTLTPLAGGATYRFYPDSTTTSPLAGGNNVNSFTTPVLTSTTTFYVSAVSASGCEGSARRAVTVRVNALPVVSISRNGDTLVATTAAGNYQWYRDGNAIAGATSTTYRVTETGVYTVAVTNTVGCTGVSNAIQVIFAGIENDPQAQKLQWNSYPVPFSSELILQAEAAFGYQLLDIRGAVLLQGQSEGTLATLNTSELASGIYFVRIAVNGQTAFRKLVKE